MTDTGEGISKDKQKQLFTPFYQADVTSTRTHGGTGKLHKKNLCISF